MLVYIGSVDPQPSKIFPDSPCPSLPEFQYNRQKILGKIHQLISPLRLLMLLRSHLYKVATTLLYQTWIEKLAANHLRLTVALQR